MSTSTAALPAPATQHRAGARSRAAGRVVPRLGWLVAALFTLTAVRTQGDATTSPDPWTASLEANQVWQVHGAVPYAGAVLGAVSTPTIQNTLLYGIPTLLAAWMLSSLRRRQN